MATDMATAPFQQWSFQKVQEYGSPASDTTSSTFFDTEDKFRITPNMEDIKEALRESDSLLDPEYQSSEEALSPVVDDDESDVEELEAEGEGLDAEGVTEEDLWAEIKVIALDIAITLSMQYVGRPKIIDMESPYLDPSLHVAPLRLDSLPPRSERRTQVRDVQPALSSWLSSSSHEASSHTSVGSIEESPESLQSRFSGSSYNESPTTAVHPLESVHEASSYTGSAPSSKRNGSIFSVANNNISSTWTPPLNEEEGSSPSASFLDTDPFETTSQKPKHNRLRSISYKISKISFGSKKEVQPEDEKPQSQKRERRNSILRSITPTSPRENRFSFDSKGTSSLRTATPQPTFIAPLHTTHAQRAFPRMMARAANERASPISLPPCPDDYDVNSPPELLRSQTMFVAPPPVARRQLNSPQFMKRRRSVLGLG